MCQILLRVLQVLSPYIFCFFFWLFLTISPLGNRGLDIGCSLSASKEIFGCFFVVRGERVRDRISAHPLASSVGPSESLRETAGDCNSR